MAFIPAAAWAAIAAGTAAISGGVGAAGAIYQGKATQAAAEFNAKVGQQQAAREREIGELSAQQYTRSQERALATTRAARLASGVQITGTPLLVDEQAIGDIALEAATIRAGGEVKASRLEQQAQVERFGGRAARVSSLFRAGGSLLQGAYGAASPFALGASPLNREV